jgi:hypothetical protein
MGKRKTTERKYTPRKQFTVQAGQTADETGRNVAAFLTGPGTAACRVIMGAERSSGLDTELDVPALLAQLRDQAVAVNNGNLAHAEAMLMNQATALQTLFARLAERGMSCTEVVPFEANMRMALRAQSQCRATLETLAAIKNPASVAFVRQANISAGPQQVNNGPAPSRAGNSEIEQSKLLEAQDGERLDTGTTGAAGAANQELEALGAVHRPTDDLRQG